MPDHLIDWRRLERDQFSWRNTSATTRSWRNTVGYGARPTIRTVPVLVPGDRVLHSTFGLGKVLATTGDVGKEMADVDFGSEGVKRLSLRHAPLEKL